MGSAAVDLAIQGENAVMPIIVRIADSPYDWKVEKTELAKVANIEKKLPDSFISCDGYGITRQCRNYLQPLIEGEDYPPYSNGIPNYVILRNEPVARKLNDGFAIG